MCRLFYIVPRNLFVFLPKILLVTVLTIMEEFFAGLYIICLFFTLMDKMEHCASLAERESTQNCLCLNTRKGLQGAKWKDLGRTKKSFRAKIKNMWEGQLLDPSNHFNIRVVSQTNPPANQWGEFYPKKVIQKKLQISDVKYIIQKSYPNFVYPNKCHFISNKWYYTT